MEVSIECLPWGGGRVAGESRKGGFDLQTLVQACVTCIVTNRPMLVPSVIIPEEKVAVNPAKYHLLIWRPGNKGKGMEKTKAARQQ